MFRIITGTIVTLCGLWLVWVGISDDTGAAVIGLVLVAVGVAIIANKNEDKIEEINNQESEHHE